MSDERVWIVARICGRYSRIRLSLCGGFIVIHGRIGRCFVADMIGASSISRSDCEVEDIDSVEIVLVSRGCTIMQALWCF